ncbi:hypothetical protein HDV00_002690 [Rhizophlyctis rosea]|nr:hypothetical protein HDV00_002690 [Rhizophlyctis rosea]
MTSTDNHLDTFFDREMGITPSSGTPSLLDSSSASASNAGPSTAPHRRASISGPGPELAEGGPSSAPGMMGMNIPPSSVPTWRGEPDAGSSTYGEGIFSSPKSRSSVPMGGGGDAYEYGGERWKRRKGDEGFIPSGGGEGMTGIQPHRDGERLMDVSSLLSESGAGSMHPLSGGHAHSHSQHHQQGSMSSYLMPSDVGNTSGSFMAGSNTPALSLSSTTSGTATLGAHQQASPSPAPSIGTVSQYPRRHSISTTDARTVPAFAHRQTQRQGFHSPFPNQGERQPGGMSPSPTLPFMIPKPPLPQQSGFSAGPVPNFGHRPDMTQDTQPHVSASAEPLTNPPEDVEMGNTWESGDYKWRDRSVDKRRAADDTEKGGENQDFPSTPQHTTRAPHMPSQTSSDSDHALDAQALLADLTATRALCANLQEIIREKDEVILRLQEERDRAWGRAGKGFEGESGGRRSDLGDSVDTRSFSRGRSEEEEGGSGVGSVVGEGGSEEEERGG